MSIEEIVKTITDWPVIVQGALGSALFWLILEGGQRGMRSLKLKVGYDRELANNWSLIAHEAPEGPGQQSARFFCLYGALHYALKAIIVGIIAIVAERFVDVFAYVGFAIMFYFVFRALSFVPHSSSHGSMDERKAKYQAILAEGATRRANRSSAAAKAKS